MVQRERKRDLNGGQHRDFGIQPLRQQSRGSDRSRRVLAVRVDDEELDRGFADTERRLYCGRPGPIHHKPSVQSEVLGPCQNRARMYKECVKICCGNV